MTPLLYTHSSGDRDRWRSKPWHQSCTHHLVVTEMSDVVNHDTISVHKLGGTRNKSRSKQWHQYCTQLLVVTEISDVVNHEFSNVHTL